MTLRIGMIGPGGMGRAHIQRIHSVIAGGRVAAVCDVDPENARRVGAEIGATVYPDSTALITSGEVDAVMICSYGAAHAADVIAAVRVGKRVLVEKPLAPTAAECEQIMRAEQEAGQKLVTVGFMRRFDTSYRQMKELLDGGQIGAALMVNCAHRNPTVPPTYTREMAINDTAIHEFDTVRWLLGEEFAAVRVDTPRATAKKREDLQDPLVVVLTTTSGVRVADEVFVHCGYGYDIQCEIVAEDGVVRLGDQEQIIRAQAGSRFHPVAQDHNERFGQAFVTEVQEWISAAARGQHTGSSAWDGYAAAVVCDAALRALDEGGEVGISMIDQPAIYR